MCHGIDIWRVKKAGPAMLRLNSLFLSLSLWIFFSLPVYSLFHFCSRAFFFRTIFSVSHSGWDFLVSILFFPVLLLSTGCRFGGKKRVFTLQFMCVANLWVHCVELLSEKLPSLCTWNTIHFFSKAFFRTFLIYIEFMVFLAFASINLGYMTNTHPTVLTSNCIQFVR